MSSHQPTSNGQAQQELCFYCQSPDSSPCTSCPLVSCSQHLGLHRPAKECLPWTVSSDPSKGRCLVAARDIKPFQTILLDQPAIIGPFDDACDVKLCLECCDQLEVDQAHSCSKCGLLLCSPGCENGPRHRDECEVFSRAQPQLQGTEDGIYCSISPLRMLAVRRDKPEVWDLVDRLMDHLPERRTEEKWRFVHETVVPLMTQQCRAGQEDREEEERQGDLIERIVGIFRTNSVKWEREREEGGVMPVGHALCPLFALMSHSCVNNTRYTQTKSGYLLVRAVRPIAKGEEITTQYRGPNEGNILRCPDFSKHWFFTCRCPRCTDPTELGTQASTLVCPGCMVPALLPQSCSPEEPVWLCQACGRQEDRQAVLELVQRLDMELGGFPYTNPPEDWEALLSRFSQSLHPDHFLCMKVKRLLLQMYGSRSGFRLAQMPRSLLDRKIELCRNYITVFSVLEPGYRVWKGRVLEELVGPLTVTVNQDLEDGSIGKLDYILRYKEIVTMVKESAKCRQFEERSNDEGLVAEFYRSWMKPLEEGCSR